MATGDLIRFLRSIAAPRGGGDATDGQLLHRFATGHDEAAFTALLQRHGPMVMGVCQRVLRHRHDAEDAFQAAFLVLVRKAGSIASPELLGNWLYGVAYRTALRAKAERHAHERLVLDVPAEESTPDVVWADLRPVLDEEVNRLPDKYRVPFVLCYLGGRTNEEAAQALGYPKGTVLSRLAWARARLRSRLTRRGLALSAGLFATALAHHATSAAVPPALAGPTVQAAMLLAAGKATASVRVAALTEGVLKAMSPAKSRIATVVLLALGMVGAGTVMLAYGSRAAAPPPKAGPQRETPAKAGGRAERGGGRASTGGQGRRRAEPRSRLAGACQPPSTGGGDGDGLFPRWPNAGGPGQQSDADGRDVVGRRHRPGAGYPPYGDGGFCRGILP
jgi:RNA polymerase sigma factor (sigma-70 family)